MRILALLIASLIGLGLILLIRATVDFRYRRQEENDHLEINLAAVGGLWKFKLQIPTAKLKWEEGPKLEVSGESEAMTGEEREAKMNVRVRYFRRTFFYYVWPKIPRVIRKFKQIKTRFYKGIHCTLLNWKVMIGSNDAAFTAIEAGSFWGVFGYSLAKLYKQVTMDTKQPQLSVIPNFNEPGFSCDIHCVFKLRMGHIMFIGLDLVRLLISNFKVK